MSHDRDITIVPVQGKKDLDAFLRLPWRIQQSDPNWVPPLLAHQRKLLDPARGPFFEIGEASYFLALQDGRPVGRLSAHVNHRHDEMYHDDTGFFGFFECMDDARVAAALFESAADWLRKRGKRRMRGPMSFGIYDEIGLLIDGFDSMPAMLQVHNPRYYAGLLEAWGFQKALDWYALKITRETAIGMADMQHKLDDIMEKQSLRLVPATPADIVRRKREVFDLFNEAWNANWGHVPFTWKQFETIISELKPVLRTDLMRLILTPQDEIAAFIITIPDLNAAIQKMNGRLTPLGLLRLYYEARLKPLGKLRTVLLGVRRDYQRKRLHHALILSSYLDFDKRSTINFCDLSLIPENLSLYLRALAKYGATRYKTWRIYDRDI